MKIPGYRIERLIGKGGSSSVYLAVQESLGRRVALKVMKKFDDHRQTDRFTHEGRIIASLNHRNIITIHDVGTIGDRPFIAMEYLQGRSLKERIDEGIAVPKVMSLLEQMAACLHFVHRRGIVHRDIKPSNILFHADGTPKLTDFGIAKLLDSDQELTLDGSALGSPYYLSPEQAEGLPLDGRSDIYALGIVFYQMLTGHKPYAKNSAVETIVAHLTQPLPVLPKPFIAYQDLLEAMIAKQPEDRVGSAKELVYRVREAKALVPRDAHVEHDTGSVVPGEPAAAASPGWPGRQQSAVVAWAFAGLLASVLVYTAVSWFSPGDATPRQAIGSGDDSATVAESDRATRVDGPPAADAPLAQIPKPDPLKAESPKTATIKETTVDTDTSDAPANALFADTPPADPADSKPAVPMIDAGPVAPIRPTDIASLAPLTDQDAAAVDIRSQTDDTDSADVGSPANLDDEESAIAETIDAAQPESDGDRQIAEWLQAADTALAALRLTRPVDDNALAYYRRILAIDPTHPAAQAGIQSIADRYAGMARRAIGRDDDRRARRYVRRGLAVQPRDKRLAALNTQLAHRAQAQALAQAAQEESPPVATTVEQTAPNDSVRGREGTGNIIKDFKGVWRAVFN